jgi:PAS domain S-box-containing protein
MIFGTYLDDEQLSQIDQLAQVVASVYSIQEHTSTDETERICGKLEKKDIYVEPLSSERVAGYTLLNDLWGHPALLLNILIPRHIYQQGNKSVHALLIYLAIFGLLAAVFELLMTENLVSKRLYKLSRDVSRIGTTEDQKRRLQVIGDDELSQVAFSVNNTLDALEQTQSELRENEHRLKSILDSVQIGVFLINPEDHSIIDANITALKMIGATKESLVGRLCHQCICPAQVGSCPITDLNQNVDSSERILIKMDGSPIPILKTVVTTVLNGQTVLIESFVDISERKKAEEALRQAHDELEIRVEERTEELAKANLALRSEIAEREQAVQEIYARLRYEEAIAACSQAFMGISKIEDILHVATDSLLTATGSSRVYVFENFEDPLIGICMRQIAVSRAEGICSPLDNSRFQQIPCEGVFSRWYNELSSGHSIMGPVSSLPGSEQVMLIEQNVKSVLCIPVFVSGNMYGYIGFDDCINIHVWNEYDIRMLWTAAEMIGSYIERTRAEEEIRIINSKNEKLLLSISSALIVCDAAGGIQEWNKAAEDILGIPSTEAINRSLLDMNLEWEDDGFPLMILESINKGEQTNLGHVSVVRPDGRSVALMLTTAPIIDGSGHFLSCLLSCSDVTELRTLEVQLHHSQKLESIGQLAAGIAHEMNTPIQYVGDNTRFLQESFGPMMEVFEVQNEALEKAKDGSLDTEMLEKVESVKDDADIEYLIQQIPKATEQSLDGINRVAKIVRAMKQFSHPGGVEHTDEDLNGAIESTITVSRNEWKYVADLVTDLDAGMPLVPCMIADLNQVILNLIVNAAHAVGDAREKLGTKEKGKITVSTRQDGDWIEIRIGDTGTGIPESIRQRVFEPFFTTKKIGKGTGQGLALARSIVTNMHGGTITFESTEGEGTTFIIRIPLLREAA